MTTTDTRHPGECSRCGRSQNGTPGEVDTSDLHRYEDGSPEGVYQCSVCGAMTSGKVDA